MGLRNADPEIPAWWDFVQVSLRRNGYIADRLWGRRRDFKGAPSINEQVNHPIQSGGFHMVAEAMLSIVLDEEDWFATEAATSRPDFDPALLRFNFKTRTGIVTQTHDSLMFEVPTERAEEAQAAIQWAMTRRAKVAPLLTYTAEAKNGMNWKQLWAKKKLSHLLEEMAGDHRLKRVLGPVTLTALGVGAVIAMIGIVMLLGLVTKNGILLVDFVNQRREEGESRLDAILQSGRIRLRPIIMTTMSMIFGMLPLAFALGEGAEQRAPMAHAVIGGDIDVGRVCSGARQHGVERGCDGVSDHHRAGLGVDRLDLADAVRA